MPEFQVHLTTTITSTEQAEKTATALIDAISEQQAAASSNVETGEVSVTVTVEGDSAVEAVRAALNIYEPAANQVFGPQGSVGTLTAEVEPLES